MTMWLQREIEAKEKSMLQTATDSQSHHINQNFKTTVWKASGNRPHVEGQAFSQNEKKNANQRVPKFIGIITNLTGNGKIICHQLNWGHNKKLVKKEIEVKVEHLQQLHKLITLFGKAHSTSSTTCCCLQKKKSLKLAHFFHGIFHRKIHGYVWGNFFKCKSMWHYQMHYLRTFEHINIFGDEQCIKPKEDNRGLI